MKLQFKPFSISRLIFKKYYLWFNNKRFREVLYQGTPKSKEEVKAWLMECIEGGDRRYFLVFKNAKLIGHIALRNINFGMKYAEVGSFFADGCFRRGRVMEETVEFIINQAQKLGFRLLAADFLRPEQPQIKAFLKNGFKRTPKAPHYLLLHL